ncbi:sugar-binding protein [Leptobacterium sp. I13]|uniref:sugar-binding protein n=1 Tax=Leptobacterium meishanense TaxID=3128904 RepID=UPI0030ECF537
MRKTVALLTLTFFMLSCNKKGDHQVITVSKTQATPVIDGIANDICWQNTNWLQLDQRWIGNTFTPDDFTGKYKLSWNEEALYILVEIVDDVLLDQYDNPLTLWWDDDCVEVFIDEDNSGGMHQYNHNAFAYHVALDGNVVDLGPDKQPHLYNDHLISKRITNGNTSTWELAVKLYDNDFKDGKKNTPKKLISGKNVGFALAYCDNDASKERENFIGSVFVPGEDKNQGWINADIFGTLILSN